MAGGQRVWAQNDYFYSLGAGVGVSQTYGDVAKIRQQPIMALGYYSHLSDYLTLSLEMGLGSLAGGDRETDPYKREFKNKVVTVTFHADVQAGILFANDPPKSLNNLRNFFIGAGVGVLSNKLVYVQRVRNDGLPGRYAGTSDGTNFILPLRIGYEFKFLDRMKQTRYRVDIAYQGNFTFGEALDGYNEPVAANKSKDLFTQVGVTFKYGL